VRQFRGEIRQWMNDAEQLRRLVQGQKLDTRQLDEVLRGLRSLQDDRLYKDVEELQRLQAAVTENMKRFEFGLRRRAEGATAQPVLSGADEVPEQFRKLVEQYYKSLSKGPATGAAPARDKDPK
jgi:chromosome condensin MukBEF ATPase and DNA-binding subunit MukB